MKNNNGRIEIFDRLRGLSILAIVFYHFIIAFPSSYVVVGGVSNFSAYFIFHNLILNIISLVLRFGWQFVGVFLFLSGFGLCFSFLKKSNNDFFLIKRLKKLFPVWQIAIIFAFITNLLIVLFGKSFIYKLPSIDFRDYFYLIIFPFYVDFKFTFINKINDTLWFIILIIQFYFIFQIIVNFMLKIGEKKYFFFSLISTIIFRLIVIIIFDKSILPFSFASSDIGILMKTLPARFFEFSLGMIFASLFIKGELNIQKLINIKYFIVGVFVWFTGTILSLNIYGWIISDIFITVGLLFVSLYFLQLLKSNLINNVLLNIGELSLYIYLFHGNLMKLIGILLGNINFYINNLDLLFPVSIILLLGIFIFSFNWKSKITT